MNIPGHLSVNGTFSNSDASIKTNVQTLSEDDTINMLRNFEPKMYDRTDIKNEKRIGFIAQETQALLPSNWQNIVRSTAAEETLDSDGNIIQPAEK